MPYLTDPRLNKPTTGTPPQYAGTIPVIAQAFQNDPRNRLAQSMLTAGTSGAPVAQGGWAVPDGLARAVQALTGAYMNKRGERRFAERERDFQKDLIETAQGVEKVPFNPAAVNPNTANPNATAMGAAAAALGNTPPPAQPQSEQPFPALPANIGAPPQAQPIPMARPGAVTPVPIPPSRAALSQPAATPASAGVPGAIPPISGGTGPSRGAARPARRTSNQGGTSAYDVVFGNGSIARPPAPPTQMTAGEVHDWGQNVLRPATRAQGHGRLPSGRVVGTSAAGAYQMVGGTLASYARRVYGDGWRNQQFSPEFQDRVGQAIFEDNNGSVEALRNQWASLSRTEARQIMGLPWSQARHVIAAGESGQLPNDGTQIEGMALGTVNGRSATGNDPAYITPPTMEAVPDAPVAPPPEAPAAPALPREVQSSRLAMAQRMLQSGNPDLVAMAQQYMDTGLTEQNEARREAQQQAFQQGQTGYGAALDRYGSAVGDARQFGYDSTRDARNRNFQREETYGDRRFTRGERIEGQGFEHDEGAIDRDWRAEQAALDRASRESIAERRRAWRQSAAGERQTTEDNTAFNSNISTIGDIERFIQLNETTNTGQAYGLPGMTSAAAIGDPNIGEMQALSNRIVVGMAGGSLGAAISNSDRDYFAESTVSPSRTREQNENVGRAAIAALRRSNDYIAQRQNAIADGTFPDFQQQWFRYANDVPITETVNGQRTTTNRTMTFDQWRSSLPTFDASGRRVNQ